MGDVLLRFDMDGVSDKAGGGVEGKVEKDETGPIHKRPPQTHQASRMIRSEFKSSSNTNIRGQSSVISH